MNISIVIPHVPFNAEADKMLDECVKSVADGSRYRELVLVINDGIGYAKAFNRGFSLTHGQFIVAVSNDTKLERGDVALMCQDGMVTYSENSQFGCFFCMPRWIYEKTGGFDESFGLAYYEDNDFLMRLKDMKIPVRRVPGLIVSHLGGVTVKALGKEQEASAFGAARWKEKWGDRDPDSWR